MQKITVLQIFEKNLLKTYRLDVIRSYFSVISQLHFDDKFENFIDLKFFLELTSVNPHTPVAQKVADEVVFRHFLGEGVEFV